MIERKFKDILPSEYAETVGNNYSKSTTEKHKKNNGQFFTPKSIADFMGNLAKVKYEIISILDPGCGTGILSCSLIEKLVAKADIKVINLKLYETDSFIIQDLKRVILFLENWLTKRNIILNVNLIQEDFLLSNTNVFAQDSLFENYGVEQHDYIISNPPYFKISKSDIRANVAKEFVYGQPNIYSLFMGLSAKLLNNEGELIFITPRSFASGNYFSAFRKTFFSEVNISDIHIFESRQKMFRDNKVLQENIIVRATKNINRTIKVTVTECDKGLNEPKVSIFKTEQLIDLQSKEKFLFIPSNSTESDTIKVFSTWKNKLGDYNIQISTGPVVAFRCKELLVPTFHPDLRIVPLLWLHNIREMEFIFPLSKGLKPGYIKDSDEAQKVLLQNKNYVFIRRFSSKDDKRRLICAPYFASQLDADKIGVENHLNYLYRPNGELLDEEIWGISALFSSTLFDNYFRTFNGNTQVGAFELKQIKIPSMEKIILIGEKIKLSLQHKDRNEVDHIISEVLLETSDVKIKRGKRNSLRTGITTSAHTFFRKINIVNSF